MRAARATRQKKILNIEKSANEGTLSMVMIDVAGRELHLYDALESFQQVDLSSLAAGVYTIIMRSDKRTASWKTGEELTIALTSRIDH